MRAKINETENRSIEKNQWSQILVLWEDQQNWHTLSQVKQEKKRTLMTNITSERGDTTTGATEILKMIKEYYETLCPHIWYVDIA